MTTFQELMVDLWERGPAAFVAIGVPAVIGAFVLLRIYLGMFGFIWSYFLRPGINPKKFGPWAAVTGATDGIGKAFCEALAKKGINLVLISRTESKLREVAEELSSKFNVQTKIVAADLTACTDAKWKELEDTLDSVELGLLINNAGMGYDHPDDTELIEEERWTAMVHMNVVALTKLCRIVLPAMKKRRSGYIVNMSSGSGLVPYCPFLSIYAGTKAYVDSFTRALDAETRPFGVFCQSQAPFFVATKLAKIRRATFDVPSAKSYVASAIKAIGYEASCSPYWVHAIMLAGICLLPAEVARSKVYAMHDSLRRRYYKKLEQQAKQE